MFKLLDFFLILSKVSNYTEYNIFIEQGKNVLDLF